MAVQLDRSVELQSRGRNRSFDAATIYTSPARVRAAQQKLAAQNYYRGSINGRLDDATHRALFQFQSDRGFLATGNLDGRTAQSLGLGDLNATAVVGAALSASQSSLLRRSAQSLGGRLRTDLAISLAGKVDQNRAYSDGDLELWFSLSAFADNTELYEQLVRTVATTEALTSAGKSLIAAARRVDAAMMQARPTAATQNAWVGVQAQLHIIEPAYASN